MSSRPDAPGRRILDDARRGAPAPEDPTEAALHRIQLGLPTDEPHLETAYSLYVDADARPYVESLLLTNADRERLCEGLRVAPEVLAYYTQFFFDTRTFRSLFVVLRYIQAQSSSWPKDLPNPYLLAKELGPDAVLDLLRVGDAPLPEPKDVAHQALGELHRRMREHRGRKLDDPIAKEALRIAKAAGDLAPSVKAVKDASGDKSMSALEIALTQATVSVSVSASPVPVIELVRTGPAPTKT